MISEDRPYRLPPQALISMVFGKLKYPLIFTVFLIVLSVGLFFARLPMLSFLASPSMIVRDFARGLYGLKKYGTFFTIMLAVFLSVAEIPEYLGFSVMLGDQALYLRSGIISHQVTAIEYAKISRIEEREPSQKNIFGLRDVSITAQKGDRERTTIIPLLSKRFRTELQKTLAERAERA